MNEKIWSFENVILFFCFAYFKKRRTSFFKNSFFCKYLQDNLLYILSKKLLILLSTSRYALFSNKRLMLDEMLKWKVSIFFDSKLFEYNEACFFSYNFILCYLLYFPTNEWMRMNTNILHSFFCLLLQKFGKWSVFVGTFYQA